MGVTKLIIVCFEAGESRLRAKEHGKRLEDEDTLWLIPRKEIGTNNQKEQGMDSPLELSEKSTTIL